MNLVVIGSSNMDLVIYLPRIPAVGETILGGKSSTVFGGKGANQAVAASRAGGNICFISKIGKDIFG
ncbi:MAG: ribokinase, partial [Bacteroidetes bacterium]|nr:ribokinase [Bacteroidota bacterium]